MRVDVHVAVHGAVYIDLDLNMNLNLNAPWTQPSLREFDAAVAAHRSLSPGHRSRAILAPGRRHRRAADHPLGAYCNERN